MSSSSAVPAATRMLTLRSTDDKELVVEESVAFHCHTIKKLFHHDAAESPNPIPIPNVTSTILAKVMEYCRSHVDAAASIGDLRKWDAEFVKVNQAILYDLLMAASYLEMESLLDLTCQAVADVTKEKSPVMIRETFDITNNTPEEEGFPPPPMAAEVDNHNGVDSPALAPPSLKLQLCVAASKADEAVSFYKDAFGAEEVSRVNYPKRKAEQEAPLLCCAELMLGGFPVLVCDQIGEDASEKAALSSFLRLEVDDRAAVVDKAVEAGGSKVGELSTEEGSNGSESIGKVKDPYGFVWTIASTSPKCCTADSCEA